VFHGFWVILGNATFRQFAVGVVIAVCLVAAFALYQRISADEGDHPSEWLTSVEQADLERAVASLGTEGHWVAGCLWDGDEKDITNRVEIPRGSRDLYVGTASTGRDMAFVVVTDEMAPAAHLPREERGSFCLVPEGS